MDRIWQPLVVNTWESRIRKWIARHLSSAVSAILASKKICQDRMHGIVRSWHMAGSDRRKSANQNTVSFLPERSFSFWNRMAVNRQNTKAMASEMLRISAFSRIWPGNKWSRLRRMPEIQKQEAMTLGMARSIPVPRMARSVQVNFRGKAFQAAGIVLASGIRWIIKSEVRQCPIQW